MPLSRRTFNASLLAVAAPPVRPPNVVYIILDDLGLNDTGCYGSQQIATPNIDRLAAAGVRFTAAYSGCTVCAPARCTLMTGKHMGHATVRANPGGVSLQAGDVTLAQVLQKAGYTCGGFGKWGIADLDTPGVPEKHGFSRFFGYYHQVHAQSYYPEYLIDTGRKVPLPGNAGTFEKKPATKPGTTFSAQRIFDEMKAWLRANSAKPFFCYAPWTIPHGKPEIPADDPAWLLYRDKPWNLDTRIHAAFVSMADRFVGETIALLEELGVAGNTLVFFSSDNGAASRYEGELDSAGGLRGKKTSMYEGGIRIPLLVKLPGRIPAKTTSDLPVYFPDILPTVAEFTGTQNLLPPHLDGLSFAPEITGQRKLPRNRPMYWEWNEAHFALPYKVRMQACRRGKWKITRDNVAQPWELYDLSTDPGESKDLAASQPKLVAELDQWVRANRVDPPEQIDPPRPNGQKWR